MVGLVFVHIVALHEVGSNNPDGVEIKKNKGADGTPLDGIPFHPYYTVKDIVGVVVFLLFFSIVVFYIPEMGGYFLERNNFIQANPLVTPEHISPLWYFTPFYTVLRAVPDPWYGVLAMGAAIFILFFMPWIDKNPIKSVRYRSALHKLNLAVFVIVFIYLGYLGMLSVNPFRTEMAVRFSELYFLFFFILWVHSKPRSKLYNRGWFIFWVALISYYDWQRIYDQSLDLVMYSWFIPVLYLTIQLLLPTINNFAKWSKDKSEPDRVQS